MAAFVIAQLEVTDPDLFASYSAQVRSTVDRYGGHFTVRGGACEVLEGQYPGRRIVVVAFPDLATARRWYASPEYAPLIPLRQKASRGTVLLVEGV